MKTSSSLKLDSQELRQNLRCSYKPVDHVHVVTCKVHEEWSVLQHDEFGFHKGGDGNIQQLKVDQTSATLIDLSRFNNKWNFKFHTYQTFCLQTWKRAKKKGFAIPQRRFIDGVGQFCFILFTRSARLCLQRLYDKHYPMKKVYKTWLQMWYVYGISRVKIVVMKGQKRRNDDCEWSVNFDI